MHVSASLGFWTTRPHEKDIASLMYAVGSEEAILFISVDSHRDYYKHNWALAPFFEEVSWWEDDLHRPWQKKLLSLPLFESFSNRFRAIFESFKFRSVFELLSDHSANFRGVFPFFAIVGPPSTRAHSGEV